MKTLDRILTSMAKVISCLLIIGGAISLCVSLCSGRKDLLLLGMMFLSVGSAVVFAIRKESV